MQYKLNSAVDNGLQPLFVTPSAQPTDSPLEILSLATEFLKAGEYSQAETMLTQLLTSDLNEIDWLLQYTVASNLGYSAELRNQGERALEWYSRALALAQTYSNDIFDYRRNAELNVASACRIAGRTSAFDGNLAKFESDQASSEINSEQNSNISCGVIPSTVDEVSTMMSKAYTLFGSSLYSEAFAIAEKGLQFLQPFEGLAHSYSAHFNLICGICSRYLGLPEQAIRNMEAITFTLENSDSPFLARVFVELGICWRRLGRIDAAIGAYRNVIEIEDSPLGMKTANLGLAYQGLGVIAVDSDDYSRAEKHYLRALDVQKAVSGDQSRPVAEVLSNLAKLMIRQERLIDAELLLLQSVSIYEKLLPSESAESAYAQCVLGELLLKKKNYVQARECLVSAINTRSRLLGHEHISTSRARFALAVAELELGKTDEAEVLYARASRILLNDREVSQSERAQVLLFGDVIKDNAKRLHRS